ncbi:MAG TPA: hemerythrin domain-containing protein [Pseudoduganella sp.]
MNTPAKDAVALLTADHDKVKQLFREYEKCDANHKGMKADIAHQICLELTIHTNIEEEIFYPAVRAETQDEQLVDEALEEHAEAKEMVERLRSMRAEDAGMDQLVSELRAAIEHHVTEEETEMFPKMRQSDADLGELCEQMQDRKEELEHELGASPVRSSADSEAAGEQSAVGQAGA